VIAHLALAIAQTVGGITFANSPNTLYVSAREVSKNLDVPLIYDNRSDLAYLGNIPIDYEQAVGATRFVKVSALRQLGAHVTGAKDGVIVLLNNKKLKIRVGRKQAVVDKTAQEMRVYEGGELILTTRVSTGKYTRSTPDGTFHVGSVKDAYHASAKYNEAPMPWAVHVTKNIFIHGGVVPDYPASHGCVRLPDDAARFFYNWSEPGTIVQIRG